MEVSAFETNLETSIILLAIACIVAIAVKRIKLPYTTALVLVGLVVSFFNLPAQAHLSHHLVFYIILPPLLFLGGLNLDFHELKKNITRILAFSLPGVLISTFVVGYLMHMLLDIELIYGLLFGALISPTDPISVLAIFKDVGAPSRLRVIVEGESLFNDGTGVVIFGIILAIITGEATDITVTSAILKFLKVAVGGAAIGFALGYITYRVLVTLTDPLLEVTITIVLAFGVNIVAEIFHMSGVIAVVTAGLLIGNYGKEFSMSKKTVETIDIFWESVDFIINSFLFLMIGLELQQLQAYNLETLRELLTPTLITIVVVFIARGASVYPLNMLIHKLEKKPVAEAPGVEKVEGVPKSWGHIFFWGGLKGSIPLALVMGLPKDLLHREEFIIISFGIVMFSLIVQSLTMKPLLKKLNIMRFKS